MLPKADDTWTLFEAAHLLNRAGFGGSPDDIRAFHALGRIKAVDSLISPVEAEDAFPLPDWAKDEQVQADMRERMEKLRQQMEDPYSVPVAPSTEQPQESE